MKMMLSRIRVAFALIGLCCGVGAYGQTAREVEDRILHDFERINRLRDRPSERVTDSLIAVNHRLLKYLTKACKSNSGLIKADMKRASVDDQMNILTSEDGKVRIFNWDTQIGSSAVYYNAIMQYYVNDSTTDVAILNDVSESFSKSGEKNPGEWYTKVSVVSRKNNYPCYLLVGKAVYTPKNMEYFIDAYAIYYGKLHSTTAFADKTKLLSSMSVAYHATDDNPEIRVAGDKQHIFVPVVNKMTDVATGKSRIYTFDGNNYVFDKNIN